MKLNAELIELLVKNEQELSKVKSKPKQIIIIKKNIKRITDKIRCPKCQVIGNIIKVGKRYTLQRRCNYIFSLKTMMYRMRNPRWKILKAIEMRKQGKSLAQIRNYIGGVSRTAIHRWLKERTNASKFVKANINFPSYTSIKSGKIVKVRGYKREMMIKVQK